MFVLYYLFAHLIISVAPIIPTNILLCTYMSLGIEFGDENAPMELATMLFFHKMMSLECF